MTSTRADTPSPLRGEGQGEGETPGANRPLTHTLSPEGRKIEAEMRALGSAAKRAAAVMAQATAAGKTRALHAAAAAIRADRAAILAANARDLAEARDLSPAMRDRLLLDEKRVEAMARGLDDVAALPDPVGRELARWTRPNGLDIARVAIPLGVD